MEWFSHANPVAQALVAGLFTWSVTALGASMVFIFKDMSRKVLDSMLGFAAGIMIAASFWSLLAPAIELSAAQGGSAWAPPAIGFIAGAIFLRIIDQLLPHLHIGLSLNQAEGIKTSWQRSILLVLAITMHNIPEGLAVGVAFGALAFPDLHATFSGAVALAIGIGIQNFPEGTAVSVPLRREGMSAKKSFWFGQLSGVVEPVAAVVGAFAVVLIKPLLPYALSFAAGAMIFVVVEELIPESQNNNNTDIATMATIAGFALMMVLDVALG
ncbi:MAG: dihydroorotate dehydrogenase [Candidatus Raymondbacteria bacterium RifOxyC12_full_50_8]|uniref:Dihydroorotate dehydrogenase n=1 Tax=Candidatus Raymondbacteria bacterium RIFOXYD12_FULL_49_13 TaxID=1817890 RepID=A0A1F7FI66_UNCRA|nr:MAG: dihydroorotate dehydrogenase [Candidatus Raymondbacteria bacterium RIFOXYA2_FULL_49_16]OGJ95687.1 MAG: dihydroorotate dehydrogenase [Candidatus Raymondbacteria bacterium RifOxyB12_full_50_8]OGK05950.1 MAG: dihydroorotate dehydrogenase [Candidatus Raymondbacteria bacterium RifOxyC12_full_50_8]OGK06308.1 MAG: dihydroorotate dehydrogenase [Candidatus Raymondbacteria bacterium RIFOXYD12_FULL_49_13]OGP40641.1 MAG: dihydroorotate dehydrogenase [Candidatus Raymondbacteria bacterium RIFOXYB2_FU